MIILKIGLLCLLVVTVSVAPPALAKRSFDVEVAGYIANSSGGSAVQIQGSATDPLFNDQWHLDRLNIPKAWDITTGSRIPIAVIDTGINLNHPDLRSRIWVNTNEIAGNNIDDDRNGYVDDINGYNFVDNSADITDEHGHGTGVASVIAAQANNTVGTAGINWQASIMPIKSLNQAGGGEFNDVTAGVRYAVENGAKIINMSFGSPSFTDSMKDVIDYALSRNVVVVAASGNAYEDEVFYPAAHPPVIAVGAITGSDRRADFSNYGANLDVVAPGEDIIIATLRSSEYLSGSGSSFAAAQVSGIVSLLLASQPSLSTSQIDQLLKSSSHLYRSGATAQLGYGVPDAYKLLTTAPASVAPNFAYSSGSTPADGLAATTITATIAGKANTSVVATISGTNNIINGQLTQNGAAVSLGNTNGLGQIVFTLATTTAETKNISLVAGTGAAATAMSGQVQFAGVANPRYQMAWVGQSAYPALAPSQSTTLWLEVRNTGNVAWVASEANGNGFGQMKLGTDRPLDRASTFAQDSSWLSPNRAALMQPAVVKPNQVARFEFNITGQGAGNFREYFRPVIEHVSWLNDLGIYWDIAVAGSSGSASTAGYAATVISQSGSQILKPNELGSLVVELRNTGTASWIGNGDAYGVVRLGTSSPQDRASLFAVQNWLANNRVMPLGFKVDPNQAVRLTFSVVAPATSGTYTERFRLVSEGITWFGPEIEWLIKVQP